MEGQEEKVIRIISGWIRSCNTSNQLDNIQSYVDHSPFTKDMQSQLGIQISIRYRQLDLKPYFKIEKGIAYYCNSDFNIRSFKERYEAVCNLFRLVNDGHDAYLMETINGYNIVTQP